MTKEHFDTLLNDLYDIYNPDKKSDIPSLLSKYNGQEFDAIYQLLFKYNYPRNPLYNPELGSPKFVKFLIESYSSGKRILKDNDFIAKNYNQRVKFEGLVDEKVSSVKSEIRKDFEGKIDERIDSIIASNDQLVDKIKQDFELKINELESLIKQYERTIPEMLKTGIVTDQDNLEIKLNILWTEHEINIPSNLKYFATGDRIITTDLNGSVIGLEIKDIYWDCVSIPGKIIKEVTIDKLTSNF